MNTSAAYQTLCRYRGVPQVISYTVMNRSYTVDPQPSGTNDQTGFPLNSHDHELLNTDSYSWNTVDLTWWVLSLGNNNTNADKGRTEQH